MKSMLKAAAVASLVLLAGCTTGPSASFSQRMRDNFLFTSASDVPASQVQCITLTKPFKFVTGATTGSVTYTLPAGSYKGRQKNRSGYFYYSPSPIPVTSMFLNSQAGIFINNQFTQVTLFYIDPMGDPNRPIRGLILPNTIFSVIKKGGNC